MKESRGDERTNTGLERSSLFTPSALPLPLLRKNQILSNRWPLIDHDRVDDIGRDQELEAKQEIIPEVMPQVFTSDETIPSAEARPFKTQEQTLACPHCDSKVSSTRPRLQLVAVPRSARGHARARSRNLSEKLLSHFTVAFHFRMGLHGPVRGRPQRRKPLSEGQST